MGEKEALRGCTWKKGSSKSEGPRRERLPVEKDATGGLKKFAGTLANPLEE
jgi:hypothetical protein